MGLSPRLAVRLSAGLALTLAYVVPPHAQSSPQSAKPCAISGLIQSGSVPLPGVAVVALGPDGAELASTSSEANGSYVLRLGAPGTYVVKASLAAFAPASRDATLSAGECSSRVDLTLTLASRAASSTVRSPSGVATSTPTARAGTAPTPSGRGTGPAGGRGRGFQQLDVVTNAAGEQAGAVSSDEAPRR